MEHNFALGDKKNFTDIATGKPVECTIIKIKVNNYSISLRGRDVDGRIYGEKLIFIDYKAEGYTQK